MEIKICDMNYHNNKLVSIKTVEPIHSENEHLPSNLQKCRYNINSKSTNLSFVGNSK